MRIYLDNAASTPIDPEVFEAMLPYFQSNFGNPSSIHSYGREARAIIEKARKTIAQLMQASTAEIFFTSGGTEADNMALVSAISTHGIKRVITSPIEHHAVLHTLDFLEKSHAIQVEYVNLTDEGNIDYNDLEEKVTNFKPGLVSLMHGNNEIGNLTDIEQVATLCKSKGILFHSDTVQTIGHFSFDLQNNSPDFVVASAHKFHGPKGIGFIYVNAETKINPFIQGGGQERNMRGGTENIYGIIGMAKALELANNRINQDKTYILSLKSRLIEKLKLEIPGIKFNGASDKLDKSLYTVLNVALPGKEMDEMLLFNLDIHKIAASAGSACSSGTSIGSHVLQAIKADEDFGHIRFSFSRNNTFAEIDYVVEVLKKLTQ